MKKLNAEQLAVIRRRAGKASAAKGNRPAYKLISKRYTGKGEK